MINIAYLLESNEPWTHYRTMIDLLGYAKDDPRVLEAKEAILCHPLIMGIVKELSLWPGKVISSHKSAGQHYHLLAFLAEIGLTNDDLGIASILDKVMEYPSDEGVFRITVNIPESYGGIGKDQSAWALCDAPLLLYSLVKMGRGSDPIVKRGIAHLQGLSQPFGWPCSVSKELGKWHGPGKKSDPCPYATLIMLQLLALTEEYRNSQAAKDGVESLLHSWEHSLEKHPYMFYMGTDFRKLKVPFIWYDILHVLDVLSHYPFAFNDPRFQSMLSLVIAKADLEGKYSPESEWLAWKDWDFSRKNKPSAWLSFLIYRILKRTTE